MIPTEAQILAIPKAKAGEYQLTAKETRTLRSRIYAINKAGRVRYRTMREGELVYVWRIH